MCMAREQTHPARSTTCVATQSSSSPTGEKGLSKAWLSEDKQPVSPKSDDGEPSTPDERASLRMREFILIYVTYMGFLACRKNCALPPPPDRGARLRCVPPHGASAARRRPPRR